MSELSTTMADAVAAADNMDVETPVNLSNEFKRIVDLRQGMETATAELDREIRILQEKRAAITGPYEDCIKVHEETIRQEVLTKTCKTFTCTHGKAVYKRGPRKVTWNDNALLGFAIEHPEIKQFREETVGKPSVVLQVGGQ